MANANLINYRAKAWKTGNSVVITVPREYAGLDLDIFLKPADVPAIPTVRDLNKKERAYADSNYFNMLLSEMPSEEVVESANFVRQFAL